jgi:hypothetical protein
MGNKECQEAVDTAGHMEMSSILADHGAPVYASKYGMVGGGGGVPRPRMKSNLIEIVVGALCQL